MFNIMIGVRYTNHLIRLFCGGLIFALLFSACGAENKLQRTDKKQEVQEETATTEPTINPDDKTQQPFYALLQEHKELISTVDDWKKVDGKYQYPINDTDDKWYDLEGAEKRYVACAIPDEIMEQLSTKELLELVMDCPMLFVYSVYNTYYEGIVEYGQYFNGMYELLHRSDFYETVLDYYQNMKIPKKYYTSQKKIKKSTTEYDRASKKDTQIYLKANFLATIITCMAERGDAAALAKAEKVLLKKDKYIRTTEFGPVEEGVAPAIRTLEGLIQDVYLNADKVSDDSKKFAKQLEEKLEKQSK